MLLLGETPKEFEIETEYVPAIEMLAVPRLSTVPLIWRTKRPSFFHELVRGGAPSASTPRSRTSPVLTGAVGAVWFVMTGGRGTTTFAWGEVMESKLLDASKV